MRRRILDIFNTVANSRKLPSDTGAFADWVANSSSTIRHTDQDLSLGFNAGSTAACATGGSSGGGGMWPPPTRQINYGLPTEMGMFVVAPASSFHHHNHHDPVNYSDHPSIAAAANAAPALGVGVGVGVIPLLSSGPCLEEDMLNGINRGGRASNIQFWHQQQNTHQNYMKKPISVDHGFSSGGGLVSCGSGGLSSASASSNLTCQDCGNQAKKDCTHRRCRTCCKSRGFDCATHVKSTWVPAARRRERQLMTTSTGGGGGATTTVAAGSSASTSGTKKPRLTSQTTTTSHTSTSNTTPPRSFDTDSSHQDVSFKEALPGQVRAPAVFKCVRVTAVDDGDDEYAYQAVVKIGGHVFKGFLYDQGLGESREAFPNLSELHLGGSGGGSGGGGGGGGRNMASSSSPMLDPSDVYAAATGGGGLLGGSTYGN